MRWRGALRTKTFLCTHKTLMCPIRVFVFTTQKQELVFVALPHQQKIVVSEVFVVLFKLWNSSVHHSLPNQWNPKEQAQQRAFSKDRFLQINSCLRAIKTRSVWRNAFFVTHSFAISETGFFEVSEKLTPFQNPYFIVFFETHFLNFLKKALKRGFWDARKRG